MEPCAFRLNKDEVVTFDSKDFKFNITWVAPRNFGSCRNSGCVFTLNLGCPPCKNTVWSP